MVFLHSLTGVLHKRGWKTCEYLHTLVRGTPGQDIITSTQKTLMDDSMIR